MTDAWDRLAPADDSLIRDYPQLARDNFQTIQDGGDSFTVTQFNYEEQGGDSSLLASNFRTYAKSDGTTTSLHGINPLGNVIQFSDEEYLGGTGQKLALSAISFDKTTDYDSNFFINAYAQVNSSGTVVIEEEITIVKVSNDYTCTFSTARANANYAIIATPIKSSAAVGSLGIYAITATEFVIRSSNNQGFSIAIIGGLA